jgi:hypothetical protein
MKSKTKKLYLASGNEHGLAWQLAVDVSKKQPQWEGTFYMAKTGKPHSQRTVFLVGGEDWQLSISVSAKQDKQWGNFYFKGDEKENETASSLR